jgi:hypothetical protein
MAKKKIDPPSLQTFTSVSDLKNTIKEERNLGQELFNKGWQQEKVDSFERSQGINTQASKAGVTYRSKTKMFNPEAIKDKELLDELLNSPKHKITYWKDNWTAMGEYRVFVIYTETIKKDDN